MNNNKKTILITGGIGFVGSHSVEHLLKNTDWNIIILDGMNYAANVDRVFESKYWDALRVKFIWHDLRSPISSTLHTNIGPVNYIWHYAAESHVDRSLEDCIPFVASNVLGTANLLEYIKNYQKDIERVLIFSTDEVFGPAPEGVYFKEDDRFKPSNPYAAAKAGEEMIAFSFAHAFRIPISIVRSMNIIAEKQHPEKFLPKTIRAVLSGNKIVLHSTNNKYSSRCWIHARNVADGMLFLTDKAETEQFYHIVGEEKTVFDIANIVHKTLKGINLTESGVEKLDAHSQRPGHDFRYALSGQKLQDMGWVPPIPLEQSLIKAIEWYLIEENKKWLNI